MLRRWSVLALALLPAILQAQGPAAATRLANAADSNVMWAHLRFLSSDLLEGRAPGTRGGEIAAHYIAAQFERLGLEPAGDSGTYYHRVPVISLTPTPTLVAGGDTLGYRHDYVLWSMRNDPRVQVSGNMVFVGYGIVAPEYGWNDYQGVDVKGKIVLMLVNDPGLRDSSIFRGKILTYYGRWTYKIEEAARQGAAGILLVHTTESATYPWSTVTSSWTGAQVRLEEPATSLVAAGWLTRDAAAALLRGDGKDLDQLMDQAGHQGFRPVPVNVQVSATVRSAITRTATENVVARYPGRGRHAGDAVLIGGHYDHLGIRGPVNGDSIYNGAEDNASGTAAVLTAAEAAVRSGVRLPRSLVFIAFAAEESGLLGSEAYAARPTIAPAHLAAALNVDVMNLYGQTRDISALGLDQSSLGGLFRRAAREEGLRVTVNQKALLQGSFFRSDHFSLVKIGVPALSLESGLDYVGRPRGWGEEQHEKYTAERYHQPGDEILPWFTTAGAMQQIRVILRTAALVAQQPGQPSWNAGSEFRAAGEARVH